MNILAFNGSPKRERSDTLHLLRAFLAGMRDEGEHDARIVHVADVQIAPCQGCFACKKNGGTCVQRDGMADILADILAADVLIFSFPLYCYGMPAPLKALVDRTMPLSSMAMKKAGDRYEHESQFDFSKLRYVMLCGSGFPNTKNNFEPAVLQFRLMFGEDATILTVPESPMFNVPRAAEVTAPYLALVRQAGREYARSGRVADATMEKLAVPMIPPETYARIANGAE